MWDCCLQSLLRQILPYATPWLYFTHWNETRSWQEKWNVCTNEIIPLLETSKGKGCIKCLDNGAGDLSGAGNALWECHGRVQGLCVPRSGWKGSCLNNHFCLLCNLFFSPKRQWQGIGKPEKESPSLSLEKDSCGFRRLDMNCQGKVAHLSKLDVFGLSFKGPNPTSSQDGGKAPQNPFWILDFGFLVFFWSGFWWQKPGVTFWYRTGAGGKGLWGKHPPMFDHSHHGHQGPAFMELPWTKTKSKAMFVFMWHQQLTDRFSNSLWFCLRWEIAGAGICWRFILWEVHFLQLKADEFARGLKCQPFSWVFRIHKEIFLGGIVLYFGNFGATLVSNSFVPAGSEALEHSLALRNRQSSKMQRGISSSK